MTEARIPTMMELFESFPFTKDELILNPKRPSATSILELKKGFLRNAQSVPSKRIGCRGAGMGHRWQCTSEVDWNNVKTAMAQARFDQYHANWQARQKSAPDPAPWVFIVKNAEPLRTDTTYNASFYPVIRNPGEPT